MQLVTRLDRARWEPLVICLSPCLPVGTAAGALTDDFERAGIPVTCLGARSRADVLVIGRLARELRAFQPALLQTFLFHANIAGRIAGRLAGVGKIVSGIRVAERRSRMRLWLDRATESLVDHHVCVSHAVAEFSARRGGLPAEKMTVIPNGVDATRFASARAADLWEFDIPAESRTVLFVGRLDPQKGPFVLLEAAEGFLATVDDLHVLLIGDGPLSSRLQAWVDQRNLGQRIHFAGWRADVAPLLKAADCLVLPSRWEGMPNVVLEAMASGLPVVATEVEGTTELIHNHQTGLLIPPDSPSELAGAVARVLGNPEQARTMSSAAQSYVSHAFTWDKLVQRFEQLYRSLLKI